MAIAIRLRSAAFRQPLLTELLPTNNPPATKARGREVRNVTSWRFLMNQFGTTTATGLPPNETATALAVTIFAVAGSLSFQIHPSNA